MRTTSVLSVTIGLFLATGQIWAHHSEGASNKDEISTVSGTVTQWRLVNPHPAIYFDADVKDSQGNTVEWIAAEGGGTVRLRKAGWTPKTLMPGDHVLIRGHQLLNGKRAISLRQLYRCSTGEKLQLGYGPDDSAIDAYRSHVTWDALSSEQVREMCAKGTLENTIEP